MLSLLRCSRPCHKLVYTPKKDPPSISGEKKILRNFGAYKPNNGEMHSQKSLSNNVNKFLDYWEWNVKTQIWRILLSGWDKVGVILNTNPNKV